MQNNEEFLSPNHHFDLILERLGPDLRTSYENQRHTRIEVGHRNRSFIIYEIRDRNPKVLDVITVNDFVADDADGATSEIMSRATNKTMELDYVPRLVFGYPVFAHLPLHMKLRWDVRPNDLSKASLGFPIVIRSQSRLHLRERGVIYMETGASFSAEFGEVATV